MPRGFEARLIAANDPVMAHIEPNEGARAKLAALGASSSAALDQAAFERLLEADVILLGVKPQVMGAAVAPLTERLCCCVYAR